VTFGHDDDDDDDDDYDVAQLSCRCISVVSALHQRCIICLPANVYGIDEAVRRL
jgi:hypothetical protein